MTGRPANTLHLHRIAAVLSLVLVFLQAARASAQNAGPERDAWQRPDEVMDALGVKAGSVVADVGCGAGYFTFHLAARVGPKGRVYAEDIKEDRLAEIRKRAQKEGVTNIETVSGAEDDPRLPLASVDVVMIVDAYHEMHHYDAMLEAVYRALKRGGLEMFSMPRVDALRSFVFSHIIHHRGQLSVYLRLNDIPIPGLYGPSGDE